MLLTHPASTEKPRLWLTQMSKVKPEQVQWLWKPWIPLGKITVLDGDPGLGKSTALLDIAARISSNGIMPDGFITEVGNVIILSAEDDEADTIVPRLLSAHANLERIWHFKGLRVGKERVFAQFPSHTRQLATLAKKLAAKLIVIDPLFAYVPEVDIYKDNALRKVLTPLARLAMRLGCAMVVLRHLNKSSGSKAIYRGAGSVAITGAARQGLLVAPDPDDENLRVWACSKTNISHMPGSLKFQLSVNGSGACKVDWVGVSHLSANELLEAETEVADKEDNTSAVEAIQQLLANGPMQSKLLLKKCKELGLSDRSIKKGRKTLGCISYHSGQASATEWWVKLPDYSTDFSASQPISDITPSATTITETVTETNADTSQTDALNLSALTGPPDKATGPVSDPLS